MTIKSCFSLVEEAKQKIANGEKASIRFKVDTTGPPYSLDNDGKNMIFKIYTIVWTILNISS